MQIYLLKKIIFVSIFASLTLNGCGGGNSSELSNESTPSNCTDGKSGGTTNVNNRVTGDLSAAYDKIEKGMNPNQVLAIVGGQPMAISFVNGLTAHHYFVNGDATNDLLIFYETDCNKNFNRVNMKTYNGTNGSKSIKYTY